MVSPLGWLNPLESLSLRRWTVVWLAVSILGACTSQSDLKQKAGNHQKQEENRPKVSVDLPTPPPESALKIDKKHDDGTFRVEGLTAHRGEYFGSIVEVEGVIAHISEDCNPDKAQKGDNDCPQPHMFIRDTSDADRQLMIVGHDHDFIERADLEAGDESHVFKGTYKKIAREFVASKYGLLVVESIDGEKVDEET